jgi:hypothetical protein
MAKDVLIGLEDEGAQYTRVNGSCKRVSA